MKNLLSCANVIVFYFLVHLGLTAQNHKLTASFHTGIAVSDMNGRFSSYNQYEVYGKLPFDLAGYYPYFDNVQTTLFPASGRAIQVSGALQYQLNKKFNIGIRCFLQPETVGIENENTAIVGWQPVSSGFSNTFTVRSVAVCVGYKFWHKPKSFWEFNANIGSTFLILREMFFVESGITDPPEVFNGLAEDFIERKDWAFTWGFGLAYNYKLSAQWGLVAGFNFNTFNFQPDEAKRYSYKINGEEQVNSLPLRERLFFFSNELTDRPNESNAARVLSPENYRYLIPQLSLGVTFGFL